MTDIDGLNAYYEATWFDYRFLWLNPGNRALHFGYWRDGVNSHSESLVEMNRVMANAAGMQPGDRVLDAGCGVGGTSFWLAEERGARPVGITPVHDQVHRALRYTEERGGLASQAAFAEADYRFAPFADGAFDVVWAQESVCHAADKSQFTREAARVLRPGGRVVVAEYLRSERPLPPAGERLLGSWLSGWNIPDIDTAGELAAKLEGSGFVDVDVDDISAAVSPSLRRLYRITVGLYPIAGALRGLRLRDRIAHGNVVGARNQWRALKKGLWRYGLVTARKP